MSDPAARPQVALLIDWENLKASTSQNLASMPDVIALKKCARRYGSLRLARAYANWADGSHEGDPERLAQQDVDPVYVRTRLGTGSAIKNSVDLRLACDAVELLATHRHLGVFIVVSGDGDLVHLLDKLNAHGRQTIVISVKDSLSAMLRTAADEVLLYDDLVRGLRPGPVGLDVQNALADFGRAVSTLRASSTDTSLPAVKAEMQRLAPFQEEELGIPTFRHLAFLAELNGHALIDATQEPYRAYPVPEAGNDLPGAEFWQRFVKSIQPDAEYSKQELLEVIRQSLALSNAGGSGERQFKVSLKSGMIWSKERGYVSQGEKRQSWRFRLNVHHPRVQVILQAAAAVAV